MQTTTKDWLTSGGKYDISLEKVLQATKILKLIKELEGLVRLYNPELWIELVKLLVLIKKLINNLKEHNV